MKTNTNWLLAKLFIAGSIILFIYSCGGGSNNNSTVSRQSCINSIDSAEAKLKQTMTPDAELYNTAITSYLKFADNFPHDTLAPVYLFNAANIAMSLTQYQRSINLYDTITVKYPTFRKAPDCVFIRGFIYDDKLKDTAKARVMYQQVIDKYPNTPLAEQARAAISILGKSYDEIIKGFEEKNKKK